MQKKSSAINCRSRNIPFFIILCCGLLLSCKSNDYQANTQTPVKDTSLNAEQETELNVPPAKVEIDDASSDKIDEERAPEKVKTIIKKKQPSKPDKKTTVKKTIKDNLKPKVIVKNVDEAKVEEPKRFVLTSLQQLPLTIDTTWTLTFQPLPMSKVSSCQIINRVEPFFDGYDDSWLSIHLTSTQVLVHSLSNFDLTYPNVGVVVADDANAVDNFNLESAAHPSIAIANIALNNYAHTNRIRMTTGLGFWPTWPLTETRFHTVNIENVANFIALLTQCEKVTQ